MDTMDHWQKNKLQMSYSSNGFSQSSLVICGSDLAVTEALIGQDPGFDPNTQLNPLCSHQSLHISLLVSTGLIRLLFSLTSKARIFNHFNKTCLFNNKDAPCGLLLDTIFMFNQRVFIQHYAKVLGTLFFKYKICYRFLV